MAVSLLPAALADDETPAEQTEPTVEAEEEPFEFVTDEAEDESTEESLEWTEDEQTIGGGRIVFDEPETTFDSIETLQLYRGYRGYCDPEGRTDERDAGTGCRHGGHGLQL